MRSTWGPCRSRTDALDGPAPTTCSTGGRSANRSISAAGFVRLGEEVEVADCLAPAAERAGRRERHQPGRVRQQLHDAPDDPLGVAERHPDAAPLQRLEPHADRLLALLADPPRVAQRARFQGGAQVVEGGDSQAVPEHPDRPRAEPRDREHLRQGGRDLGVEAFEERQVTGRRQLGDLVRDRLPDPGDPRRASGPVGSGDLDRAVRDRVGGTVIGDRLEDELPLDLEQIADLVEDARQVPVREQRHLVVLVVSHPVDGTRRGPSAGAPRRHAGRAVPGYAASTRLRP